MIGHAASLSIIIHWICKLNLNFCQVTMDTICNIYRRFWRRDRDSPWGAGWWRNRRRWPTTGGTSLRAVPKTRSWGHTATGQLRAGAEIRDASPRSRCRWSAARSTGASASTGCWANAEATGLDPIPYHRHTTWRDSSYRSCAVSDGRTTVLCRDGPVRDPGRRRSGRPDRFLHRRRPESASSSTAAWNWTCDSASNAEPLLQISLIQILRKKLIQNWFHLIYLLLAFEQVGPDQSWWIRWSGWGRRHHRASRACCWSATNLCRRGPSSWAAIVGWPADWAVLPIATTGAGSPRPASTMRSVAEFQPQITNCVVHINIRCMQ